MGETVAFPTPLPRKGEVFLDPRGDGRSLRVSWHPDTRMVVLSIWRGERCVATHRLDSADLGRLVHTLIDDAVDAVPHPTAPLDEAGAPAGG